MKNDQLKEDYLIASNSYRHLEKKEERYLTILSVLRFFTFLGGLVLIWTGFTKSILFGVILTLIITILFLYLLKLFSEHLEKKRFISNLILINQNEAKALSGDLTAFPPGSSYTDVRHDFSFDVDLFGISSLFQYLNRTVTDYGSEILANWITNPYELSEYLISRQEAVKELASKINWRQKFMAYGMKTPMEKNEISALL